MSAYGERDVLDLISALTETIDSTSDIADRARLLATARRTALEALDARLYRLVFDLAGSGWRHYEIAEVCGVDRLTVGRWISKHRSNLGLPATRGADVEEALANAVELRAGYKG